MVYHTTVMRAFEIFLQADKITASDFQKLVKGVSQHENDFTIEVEFGTSSMEFYLYAQKDLSLLETKLEGFVLKPTERKPIDIKNNPVYQKIRLKLSAQENILEVRENEEIKKQRTIQHIFIRIKNVLNVYIYSVLVILQDKKGKYLYSSYYSLINPLQAFELDFTNNLRFKKRLVPIYLKIDETEKLFTTKEEEALLEVFGFPHFSHPIYFPLNSFEFNKHSLIVGQTGVGKTKFLELIIKNIAKHNLQDEYVIVVIDPHASLYPQLLDLEKEKINFDFIRSSCDLFPSFSEPKIATELTILLFKTLLKDQFNAKMERILKYTVYILFLQNKMSLGNLKKFLIELEFRKEILSFLGHDQDYLSHFFETEFVEMQTKFYEIAIMPILVLIDELSFVPAFSAGLSSNNLEESLKTKFLITFSLNRISLGEKAIRLIAGLIIQQLFLIAQKRTLKKKIILIVDEVSIVENESLTSILSEARKFDLSLFLSQQYLTQTSPELLKGILSNVFNYIVFKVSDEDAKILVKNLDIVFPDDILIQQKEKGFSDEDLKRNLLVTLNPRECLVRVFTEGKFYPCFKAKTQEVK